MTKKEIEDNLCYYETEGPSLVADGTMDQEDLDKKLKNPDNCYCDNCYYGRTKLAKELLKYHQRLTDEGCLPETV
jgi:hypothetical protein